MQQAIWSECIQPGDNEWTTWTDSCILAEVAAEALTANGWTMKQGDLTFAEVLHANRVRCRRWHDADSEPWTGADWSNAMCGEAGEAANVVKKLRRHETRTSSPMDPPEDVLRTMLADEIADTFLYLALLADHYGVDMPSAIVSKFNRVSERQGFSDRLRATS